MPTDVTDPPSPPSSEGFLERMSALGDLNRRSTPEPAPEPKAEPAPEPKAEPKTEPKDPLSKVKDPDPDLPRTPLDDLDIKVKEDPKEDEDEDPEDKETPEKEDKDEEDDSDQTPAGRRFKELKGENKAFKAKLSELESTLGTKDTRIKELEAELDKLGDVREEMEKFQKERSVLRLEQTDEFKQAVTTPLQEVMTEAYKVADGYKDVGFEDNDLSEAFAITDRRARNKALRELQEKYDMDPEDKDVLVELGAKVAPLLEKRAEMFRDAEKALLEIEERQGELTRQQALERAEKRKSMATVVSGKLESKIPFLKGMEGVDFEALRSSVSETDPGSLDITSQVYNQMAGELLPVLANQYAARLEEIDNFLAELDELRGADPTAGQSGKTNPPSSGGGAKKDESFLDRLSSGSMFGA